MSNIYNILVIGDSRAKLLEPELNKTSLNLSFTVKVLPGAGLHRITLKALTSLSYDNAFDLLILAGGINDLTKLVHLPTRHALPRYNSANNLAEAVLFEMRKSINKISKITSIPLVLATLPGMDLVKYSPDYNELLAPFQPALDEAVTTINKQIRGINRLNGIHTLNLAYPVHRCKGKGGHYRNQYSLLLDGLHPGSFLRAKWVNSLISFCTKIFPEVTFFQVNHPPYQCFTSATTTNGYW